MSNVDRDHLEDLLRHASPRPVPAPADEAAVRAAVKKEWQATTGTRRRRRRVLQFALAATVVLAAFVAFNSFRTSTVVPVQVGTIAKSFGQVYLLGEGSEPRATNDLASVVAGQTIVTGPETGLAIAWGNGGSLRVDEDTRLSFAGPDRIRLESGRVYFDSVSSPMRASVAAAKPAGLVLVTDHGDVQHVGTQYMARVDRRSLVVSVREGHVNVQGRFHSELARPGQQLTLAGSAQPSLLNIARSGGDWAWIDRTTPAVNVEGRTLDDFLNWACREMGLSLVYRGNAEARAREHKLVGTINRRLSEAVPDSVATYDLDWNIEEGVLYISDPAR